LHPHQYIQQRYNITTCISSHPDMLKRLSATLAPSSSTSNDRPSSISPSQSIASLDRLSTASSYNQYYSNHHAPSLHDIDTASSNNSNLHAYPRPSGLSTPYADHPSPSRGYFGVTAAQHSSSSVSNGGLSPSLHAPTSRNVSPAQSPRLEDGPLYPQSTTTAATTTNNWASRTPPNPIDRPTLQKSLKCLETLLVAMDEYRELSTRLAKVEKRLAKAGKELAGSMTDGNGSGSTKSKEPSSTCKLIIVTQ